MASRVGSKSASVAPTAIMLKAGSVPDRPGIVNITEDQDGKFIDTLWTALKTNGERYKPLWDKISKKTGITTQPDYMWNNQGNKAQSLDDFVDDPTSAVSVIQAGDYLVGIMWETGEGIFTLKPSRYVLELVDAEVVKDFYQYATNQSLYHINHPDCGFISAMQPYAYDQFAFGNSGIGLFKNQAFLNGTEVNCINARQYGIDNTRIKGGKSDACDYGGVIYHWSVARIVKEFCGVTGGVDSQKLADMPEPIQKSFANGQINDEYDLVFVWLPREDYDPKKLGARGYKYRGVWFMDQDTARSKVFCEENFRERPINWARQIKVRGEDYGRSSGTLVLSTINCVNYAFAITTEILEKMADPSLGMFGNAVIGDGVLDTSSGGLTIFNQAFMQGETPPVFPLHTVGDPAEIIKWFIPYLNDKVTSAFKIDALLDFNSDHEMSATESLQRYNIRGKSLSGILIRQKNELLIPCVNRAVSICLECGELGVNPHKRTAFANKLKTQNKHERIIPDEVLQVMAAGKPWFEIEFNNELEKLIRTQKVQALAQFIQFITAVAAIYPDVIHAIDWYELIKNFNDYLDIGSKILISAKDFKATIANAAKAKAAAMQSNMAQQGASAMKDGASAQNQLAQAGAIKNGQTQAAGIPTG